MLQLNRMLVMAALALSLTAAATAAQQTSSPGPVPPATISAKSDSATEPSPRAPAGLQQAWDQTRSMTRKEWNAAKRAWAMEKVKWRDCNRRADAQRLTTPKSWSFIAGCMTGT